MQVIEIRFRHDEKGDTLPQAAKVRLDNRQEALGVVPDFLIQSHADFMRRAGLLLQAGGDVEPERRPAAKVRAEFLVITPDLGFGGCGLKLQQDAFARGHGEGRELFAVPADAMPVGAFV